MSETILLMGLPNVGKSALFNRLTGLNAQVANYGGTTVELASGTIALKQGDFNLIDVPGTYSLEASCDAERVAVDLLQAGKISSKGKLHCHSQGSIKGELQRPSAVLYVLDANNLVSSLYLLMQVLEYNLPTVVALNRNDLANEKGYQVDVKALEKEIGVPVVTTLAVKGTGVEELKEALGQISLKSKTSKKERAVKPPEWRRIEDLSQRIITRHGPTTTNFRQKLGGLLVKPWPGLPIAFLVICMILLAVVGLGMGLRQFVLLPFFNTFVFPHIENLVSNITQPGLLQNVLIGNYGFLIKGIEWPFALVLPYIISFYITLSLLEDSGYMPRLGVLFDGLFKRIGLQGTGIIPLLLGYGCAIPAILSTRALNQRKQRLIITTMICLAVPCISQTGAFISLLAAASVPVMIAVFALSFFSMIIVATIMNRLVKGPPPETLIEIPELLVPRLSSVMKKMWFSVKQFIRDGAFPMIAGVAIAALLYETGLMASLGQLMSPVVVGFLGLPPEAAVPLMLGILRRELTVLPLMEMDLTVLQLFVGASVALFYVPCIAVIASLFREFGFRLSIGILLLTTVGAFAVGGAIYQFASLIM